jgi:cell division protein FtsL
VGNKKVEKIIKKVGQKFGHVEKMLYLCSVKEKIILTT